MNADDFLRKMIERETFRPTEQPFVKVDGGGRHPTATRCIHITITNPILPLSAAVETALVSLSTYRLALMTIIGPRDPADARTLYYYDVHAGQCPDCHRIYWARCELLSMSFFEFRPLMGVEVRLNVGRKLEVVGAHDVIFGDSLQYALVKMAQAIVEEAPGLKSITFTDWEYKRHEIGTNPVMPYHTVEMRIESRRRRSVRFNVEEVERNPAKANEYAIAMVLRHLSEEE